MASPSATRPASPPVVDHPTASPQRAPAKKGGVSLPKYHAPAAVAPAPVQTPKVPLPLAAQAAENKAIKAYALAEAERDGLAAKSTGTADTRAAAPDTSQASDNATFERHRQALIGAATENRDLQKALSAEAKQALAAAKEKLDTSKPNGKDAASKNYDEALAASRYADSGVKTAERILLKTIGDKRGLALATEDKVVAAFAKVRLAEDNLDSLDKPFSDLFQAADNNLRAWKAAVADAEKHGDENEIKACKAGEIHASAMVSQAKQRHDEDL